LPSEMVFTIASFILHQQKEDSSNLNKSFRSFHANGIIKYVMH